MHGYKKYVEALDAKLTKPVEYFPGHEEKIGQLLSELPLQGREALINILTDFGNGINEKPYTGMMTIYSINDLRNVEKDLPTATKNYSVSVLIGDDEAYSPVGSCRLGPYIEDLKTFVKEILG